MIEPTFEEWTPAEIDTAARYAQEFVHLAARSTERGDELAYSLIQDFGRISVEAAESATKMAASPSSAELALIAGRSSSIAVRLGRLIGVERFTELEKEHEQELALEAKRRTRTFRKLSKENFWDGVALPEPEKSPALMDGWIKKMLAEFHHSAVTTTDIVKVLYASNLKVHSSDWNTRTNGVLQKLRHTKFKSQLESETGLRLVSGNAEMERSLLFSAIGPEEKEFDIQKAKRVTDDELRDLAIRLRKETLDQQAQTPEESDDEELELSQEEAQTETSTPLKPEKTEPTRVVNTENVALLFADNLDQYMTYEDLITRFAGEASSQKYIYTRLNNVLTSPWSVSKMLGALDISFHHKKYQINGEGQQKTVFVSLLVGQEPVWPGLVSQPRADSPRVPTAAAKEPAEEVAEALASPRMERPVGPGLRETLPQPLHGAVERAATTIEGSAEKNKQITTYGIKLGRKLAIQAGFESKTQMDTMQLTVNNPALLQDLLRRGYITEKQRADGLVGLDGLLVASALNDAGHKVLFTKKEDLKDLVSAARTEIEREISRRRAARGLKT